MTLSTLEITELVIGGALSGGTPVLFATTGEILSQRAGIVNLGLEGAMLIGAVAATWTYVTTGSLFLAVLVGAMAGGLLGTVHAALVEGAKVEMLASGLCIFFIGRGLSAFAGYPLVGKRLPGITNLSIPFLSSLPLVGKSLFSQDALVYLGLNTAVLTYFFLFYSKWGLMVRATGENATTAMALGVPTHRVRLLAVTAGSALAGIGGAYIVLGFSHTWLQGVTGGRGWVSIGLVILARWNPLLAILVAYIFGGAIIVLQLNAQAAGSTASPYLLAMLPYLLTIIVLVITQIWVRRTRFRERLTQ